MGLSRREALQLFGAAAAAPVTGPLAEMMGGEVLAAGLATAADGTAMHYGLMHLSEIRRCMSPECMDSFGVLSRIKGMSDPLEFQMGKHLQNLLTCAAQCRFLEKSQDDGLTMDALLNASEETFRQTAMISERKLSAMGLGLYKPGEMTPQLVSIYETQRDETAQWLRASGAEGSDLRSAARLGLRQLVTASPLGDTAQWEQCDKQILWQQFHPDVEGMSLRDFLPGDEEAIRYVLTHARDLLPKECVALLERFETELLAEEAPGDKQRPVANPANGGEEKLPSLPHAQTVPALPAPAPMELGYQLLEPRRVTPDPADPAFRLPGAVVDVEGLDAERLKLEQPIREVL